MAQVGIKVLPPPASCLPLARAHSVPHVALAEAHLEGMGGGHCSLCLSGVKAPGLPPLLGWVLLPYPNNYISSSGNKVASLNKGVTESRGVGSVWEVVSKPEDVILKRAGQGQTRPSSRQGRWWHRAENRSHVEHQDLALNRLAGISVPPLHPFPRVSVVAWAGEGSHSHRVS